MADKLIRITTVPISLQTLLKGQLYFMRQYYNVTAISSEKEALEEVAKEEKVSVFVLELTRKITLWKDLKALFKLYNFLKKENPLIVHTHTPKAGLIGMMAAYLARVPIRMHTVAGLPVMETMGLKKNLLFLTERMTTFCATNVYPNSQGLKRYILQHNLCEEEKIDIIAQGSSNGINTDFFSPIHYSLADKERFRNELKINQEDFIFCFVGRLVKDKGINELVKVFAKINSKYPQTKLLLVGPFEKALDPLLLETEVEIKDNQSIILTGFQKDIRPYLVISNILVFPSYREGFPNVVMQAGAMGLPAIVTDINGCNEIIVEGENGTIIPPKNEEALMEKMELLFKDGNLRDKMKSKAREMITSRYEQQLIWNALLAEYKRLENGINNV